jgi:hypothetical protein
MPSLVLVAKDRAGNDLSAVLVTMDGLPFADNLDGTAIQVDPGEHRFVFEGEGLPPMEKVVVAHEGDRSRHVNVVLGVATGNPGDDRKEPLFSPNHRRIAGIGLAAAGGLGLIVGSIFGLVAKSTYDRAWIECGSDPRGCTPQGVQDGSTAHSQATVSTASFVAGVLLAGGGAALYFTAPKANAVAVGPTFGVDGPQLRIRAVW